MASSLLFDNLFVISQYVVANMINNVLIILNIR